MLKPLGDIIKHLTETPKTLFLIDSVGAFLTTFFLLIIGRYFNEPFGVAQSSLTYLTAIAACLCIYSTNCFFFLKGNWPPFIIAISMANLFYCILTFGLIIYNYPQVSIIGTAYFLGEIGIIISLVYIELNVAAAIKRNQPHNT